MLTLLDIFVRDVFEDFGTRKMISKVHGQCGSTRWDKVLLMEQVVTKFRCDLRI